MEKNRARADEQRFFAYELESRRKRQDSGVTIFEKIFSWGYLLTSGYGRFIWIPLLWLFFLAPALMAVLYAIILGIAGGPGLTAETVAFLWFLYEPTLNPLAGIDLSHLVTDPAQGPTTVRELAVYALRGFHRLLNVILLFLTGPGHPPPLPDYVKAPYGFRGWLPSWTSSNGMRRRGDGISTSMVSTSGTRREFSKGRLSIRLTIGMITVKCGGAPWVAPMAFTMW